MIAGKVEKGKATKTNSKSTKDEVKYNTSATESNKQPDIEMLAELSVMDEESVHHTNVVDIEILAEQCVLESETAANSSTEQEYIESLMGGPHGMINFTIDEEFKVYELEAMKESLIDGCFKIQLSLPNFLGCVSKIFIDLSKGQEITISKENILWYHKNFRNFLMQQMDKGKDVWNILNSSFYIFKDVPDFVRKELFQFSLGVMDICFRAFFKHNSNKTSFVEQKKAAGIENPTLLHIIDHVFPGNRYALKSIDRYALAIFESPWAARREDEVFFTETLDHLGNIVKDDVKLGTIFVFLVLSTPGENLSDLTKNDPVLTNIRNDISELLYKYLQKNSNGVDVFNQLLGLIGSLHQCRSIHLYGRLEESYV